jgi:chromate transport protein ChrA
MRSARTILSFLAILPSALTPAVWLWLHYHYGSSPQGQSLCSNLTILYLVATTILAILGRAWARPFPWSGR